MAGQARSERDHAMDTAADWIEAPRYTVTMRVLDLDGREVHSTIWADTKH